ncbi:fumarylacetoacetate hydrolase family protein [Curvibacter sp. APW13]|uniref:fumarylacetoacetate hydrolase family protein n=1 Tax=Curvibacter sp. APW13 TaxID=3077236 RepID=UPI0028DE0BC6|nr:fumarylacetoacetate hydrolase family protein [Curvibacter sp. APW13]MDT8991789.1 fumarylacetoacetate hydrolase family protein [Curvibacter sp. APW13]
MNYLIPPTPIPSLPIAGTTALFPVRRIYCVGRNYAEHAQEMGHSGREAPFFFMKPADAVLPGNAEHPAAMPYPSLTANLHHEVELVVAIGKGGANIAVADAASHIAAYAVGLDMTRRDLQAEAKKQGRPWCIAKGFDHSAPIGPLVPAEQVPGLGDAAITLHVNGTLRQSGRISDMIYNLAETIAEISKAWALQPGDLIFTGTPAGVAAVQPGDTLLAQVEGLPALAVRIDPATP